MGVWGNRKILIVKMIFLDGLADGKNSDRLREIWFTQPNRNFLFFTQPIIIFFWPLELSTSCFCLFEVVRQRQM